MRVRAKHRTKMIEKVENSLVKVDETIRGNGKEGLNQRMGKLEEKLDELLDVLQDAADFALRMNTGKFRAITRDEIEKSTVLFKALAQEEIRKALESPGMWLEFRNKWLFPIILSVVTGLIGAWVGSHFIP